MKKLPPKYTHLLLGIFLLVLIGGAFQACKTYYFRANYKEYNTLLHDTKNLRQKTFLKAHLKDGGICVFQDSWQIDTIRNTIFGNGNRFDFNRENRVDGLQEVHIDKVAIFEINARFPQGIPDNLDISRIR